LGELPGPVALFGSGETSPWGRKVYDWVFSHLGTPPPQVAVLESPAGFQPNSALVAGKVADYLREHLRNHRPQITLIPARQRGTPFSPDDPALLAPMLQSNVLFLGPGSPTYAVRQLRDSLAWGYLLARHRLGAALVLASAATIAASARALPVYEIYKVGEELHWQPGLDLFGPYGLSLALIPHWDNREGGAELDTSHCFMGQERFQRLLGALPPEMMTVVGIDEHTALVMDLAAGLCRVMGRGGVTLILAGEESHYASGQSFPADRLGSFHLPEPGEGLVPEVWEAARAAQGVSEIGSAPTQQVLELVQAREEARNGRDWPLADDLRRRIVEMGWQLQDTPEGPRLEATPSPSATGIEEVVPHRLQDG